MGNSLLVSTSIAALVLGASGAVAEESIWSNSYISLFGGYSSGINSHFVQDGAGYDTSFKDGFTVGGAYGQYLTPSLRGELEVSYRRYDTDTSTYRSPDSPVPVEGHVDSLTVFLNLWKDIDVGAGFTPYVGGGVGVGYGRMSIDWGGEKTYGQNVGFASQLGAGIRMDVSDRLKLDIGYRLGSVYSLVAANDRDATGIVLGNYYSHSVQAGVSYMLGDVSGDANAINGFPSDIYYTLFAGAALPQEAILTKQAYVYDANNKTGFTTGVAIGTSLQPGWRGELEVAYSRYAHDNYTYFAAQNPQNMSGSTDLYTLTANLWKDKPIGAYTTYVGGGVGFGLVDAHGEMNSDLFDGTGLGLALQFGAGVRRAVSDDLAIDFGYRARGVYGAQIDGIGTAISDHLKGSYLSHMLQVGLTYGNGMFEMPETDDPVSQGHYVSLFGGVALAEGAGLAHSSYTHEINYDAGFTVGGAIGTQIADHMRGELELSYVRSKACGRRDEPDENKCEIKGIWSTTHSTTNLLANVWKDFDTAVISPYVGGGVGLSLSLTESDDWGDPAIAMAAQVGGGVRYAVNDDLTFDLGYRFKGVFDPLMSIREDTFGNEEHGVATFFTHTVTGGLSWDF